MRDISTADPCYDCPWQKRGCTCPILKPVIDEQAEQIKAKDAKLSALEGLKDTVQISCNPPADCNDPVVLKKYMKACFDKAMSI